MLFNHYRLFLLHVEHLENLRHERVALLFLRGLWRWLSLASSTGGGVVLAHDGELDEAGECLVRLQHVADALVRVEHDVLAMSESESRGVGKNAVA